MTDPAPTLAACPFCGGHPWFSRRERTDAETAIECSNCGVSTKYHANRECAEDAWNRRTPSPAPATAAVPSEGYFRTRFAGVPYRNKKSGEWRFGGIVEEHNEFERDARAGEVVVVADIPLPPAPPVIQAQASPPASRGEGAR